MAGTSFRKASLCVAAALLTSGLFACASARADERLLTGEAVRADLDEFVRIVSSTHPDLGYTTKIPMLQSAAASIRERVRARMTVREAWRLLAELNPVFRDAHVGLQYPTEAFDEYRRSGGPVFALPVYVADDGTLRVADDPRLPSGLAPHDVIRSINGIASDRILTDAMPLMRGETESVQRLVLQHNFAAYLWTLYGPQDSHSIVIRDADGRDRPFLLPRSSEPMRAAEGPRAFRYEMLNANVCYMELRSFDPALKKDFDVFLAEAFATLRSAGTQALIIDIRRNPGGAHELSDALLGYLTSRRVRSASSLIARVHESNRDIAPGRAPGEVVVIEHDEWLEPVDRKDRFDGKVYLLIGRRTYSQAIVFATTFQDFRLGTVVGVPTDGWANQTGQVTMTKLSHTGLFAAAPLYIIIRPNGDKTAAGVMPDLRIEDDPAHPRQMVDQLLNHLGCGQRQVDAC